MTRLRTFLGYLTAYSTTMLGDRFADLALPVSVLAVTGNPAAAGLVAGAGQLPALILAPILGQLVDFLPRRGALVVADLLRFSTFGAFAFLAINKIEAVVLWCLVAALTGIGTLLFGIASQAIIPDFVARDNLGKANATLEVADSSMTIIGPAVAGAFIGRLGYTWGLLFNALTFFSSGLILRVFLPAAQSPQVCLKVLLKSAATWRSYTAPIRMILGSNFQRTVQVALSILSLHGITINLSLIVLAQNQLQLSLSSIGLILSAAGVGGLLASFVAIRYSGMLNRLSVLAVVLAVSGVATVFTSTAQNFLWLLASNLFLDAWITVAFICTATVRQAGTKRTLLGRVGAGSAIFNNFARALGAVGFGILLSTVGPRVTIAADAILLLTAAAYVTCCRKAQPLGD